MKDFSKRWLAQGGLWFQAIEAHNGMEEAIRLDEEVWARFTAIEAGRIR